MSNDKGVIAIDSWLTDVRKYVSREAPDVLPLLDVYLGEAKFGRQYIATDLMDLSQGASVLEVGAGTLLLSCQLVREGFNVTALEPVGEGFSHFERLQKLVLDKAEELGCLPRILEMPAEHLSEYGRFDYAFSINVMEHVEDIGLSITKVGLCLKLGATYRFACPNYLFPYEPHFNIPTLFSKKLTEKVLGSRIYNYHKLLSPTETWKSINWINVIQIRKIMKRLPGLKVTFNRRFLVSVLARIVSDPLFATRRSKWFGLGVLLLVRSNLHHLACCVPAMFQPVIDCAVTRTGVRGE